MTSMNYSSSHLATSPFVTGDLLIQFVKSDLLHVNVSTSNIGNKNRSHGWKDSIEYSSMADEAGNVANTSEAEPTGAERDEDLAVIEIATLITIFVLIVIGNLFVLIALIARRQKISRMYFFLLWLSIADLITGFFNVLPQLAWDVTYRFYGGNLLCKAVKYLQILGPYLSSYVLMMTAIDRYQVVCFPLSNATWNSHRSKTMIIVAWGISALCCAPQVFIFSYQEVPGYPGVHDCWGTFPQPYGERIYVTWYAISVFFLPLIVIIFCYVCICREIWRNVYLKRHHMNPSETTSFTAATNRTQVTANGENGQQLNQNSHDIQASSSPAIRYELDDGVSLQCHSGSTNCDIMTQSSKSPSPSSTTRSKSRSPGIGFTGAKLLWRVRSSAKRGLGCGGQRSGAAATTTELVLADEEQVMDEFEPSGASMALMTGTPGADLGGESHPMTAMSSSSVRPPKRRSRHGSSVLSALTRSTQKNDMASANYTPRSHSTKGLSRAKIKTIKITVVVILCYISCSSPFLLVQLWAYWWPNAQSSALWSGPVITILMLLSSLNSCVNPWIYLLFNDDLSLALKRTLLCGRCGTNRPTTPQFVEHTSGIGTTATAATNLVQVRKDQPAQGLANKRHN